MALRNFHSKETRLATKRQTCERIVGGERAGKRKQREGRWQVDSLPLVLLSKPQNRVAAAKSLQLCPTLCDPIDISPPGSPAPGILQARKLEWVAISFSNA